MGWFSSKEEDEFNSHFTPEEREAARKQRRSDDAAEYEARIKKVGEERRDRAENARVAGLKRRAREEEIANYKERFGFGSRTTSSARSRRAPAKKSGGRRSGAGRSDFLAAVFPGQAPPRRSRRRKASTYTVPKRRRRGSSRRSSSRRVDVLSWL